MNKEIKIESLLGIAITVISTGIALITAGKIFEGVIVSIIGFLIITARAMLKKYRC